MKLKRTLIRAAAYAAACLLLCAVVLPCIPALPVAAAAGEVLPRINVAKGATVQASSEYNDSGYWITSSLTDGYKMEKYSAGGPTLGWRSGYQYEREVDITITLTFDAVYAVDGVALYPRGDGNGMCFPDDYTVELSADGQKWTKVADVVGDTALKVEGRFFDFEGVNAKYLRLHITKRSAETDGAEPVVEISEIEVFQKENGVRMELNKSELWMPVGAQEMLTAVLSEGNDAKQLTFASSNESVVKTDAGGRVTAVGTGNATVTVTDQKTGATAKCTVKVLSEQEQNILTTALVWGNEIAVTEQQFAWMRDADIDIAMAVGHLASHWNDDMLAVAKAIWDDDAARNLQVLVHGYTDGVVPASDDATIRAYAEKYRYSPALAGYHIEDEPWDATPYARVARLLAEADPGAIVDINYLPNGYGSWEEYYAVLADYGILCGDANAYISYDYYPYSTTPDTVDDAGLFNHLEAARRAALVSDTPLAFYVQSVGMNSGKRRPDADDIRYEVSAALAYGTKWLKYFSWFVPGHTGTGEQNSFSEAVIDRNGNKTDLYDAVAEINRYVHNVGTVLAKLDSTAVYHSTASAAYEKVPADFFVQPVGGSNAIISLFTDPTTGQQYLMLVNKDLAKSQTLTFSLKGVGSLIELDKTKAGGTLTPNYKNGTLTRTFAPGEFALYKLPAGNHYTPEAQKSDNLLSGSQMTAGSSLYDKGYHAVCATDGVTVGKGDEQLGWRFSAEDGKAAWAVFDMGSKQTFNRLDLYPAGKGELCGSSFPQSLKVLVSDNGTDWKVAYEQAKLPRITDNKVPTYTFKATSGRYVKLEMEAYPTAELAEIALYNDNGSIPTPPATSYVTPTVAAGENLAFNKAVSASSAYVEGNAWRTPFLTDGQKMNTWPTTATLGWSSAHSSRPETNEWVSVDLGAIFPVNEILLYPRGNGGICFPSDYTVQVSADSRKWIDIATVTGAGIEGEVPREFTFDTKWARYVRVCITRHGFTGEAGFYSAFSELEVYGDPNAAPPPPETEPTEPTTEPATENPKTGETASVAPAALLALAAGTVVFFRKRK